MEMKNIIENKKKFIEWNLTKWLYHETSSVYDIHLKEITNLSLLLNDLTSWDMKSNIPF